MAHFVSRFLIALLCLLFWQTELLGQIKVCSWNIQHLGKTKSHSEIGFMANTIKDFDIVAIQEVVAGYGGSQAVARLADALNRKGSKWEYIISDPTNSSPHATERYAFLWKASKVKGVREAWLDKNYEANIDREPFLMDFIYNGNNFTLVNFHAIPKKKQPEREIKYFKYFPEIYTKRNLIFLGDFNVPETHTVFNPLKKIGYKSALTGQKTTMKMKCVPATCLASEYDNIFYNSQKIILIDSGAELIYKSFPDMVAVRRISDHIPIWMEFDISTTTSHHTPVATSNK
jgi:deoxyribonuclease-1-like protein